MKYLLVNISIGRFSGSQSGWTIKVGDESSRQTIVELDLTDEQMGQALGGLYLSDVQAEVNINTGGDIGKKHSMKVFKVSTEGIEHPYDSSGWALLWKRACKQARSEGYQLDGASYNSHKHDRKNKLYTFVGRRYD